MTTNIGKTPQKTSAEPSLPKGVFDAPLKGRIVDNAQSDGLVVVKIDAMAHGVFTGRVHVALRGIPIDGGGVSMIDNVAGLLPTGASSWYSGSVVGLQGQHIELQVQTAKGKQRFLLKLKIDANAGTVSGTINGLAG